MGSNPQHADLREGRETQSTGGVRDEVQEGTTVRDQRAVGGEAVQDGTHTVLANTESDVATSVVTETGGRGLEVDRLLGASEVGGGQIGRATHELGDDIENGIEDVLGELPAGDGGVRGGVDREGLLPALGEIAAETAGQVVVLTLVLFGVLGQELVPLLLGGSAAGGDLVVEVVDLLGNDEALLGVEAPLLLELLDVVGLEGRAVDTVGALVLGTKTNDGVELDEGGLVLGLLAFLDSSGDALEVVVAVIDDDDLPAVALVSLLDILGESQVCAAVD